MDKDTCLHAMHVLHVKSNINSILAFCLDAIPCAGCHIYSEERGQGVARHAVTFVAECPCPRSRSAVALLKASSPCIGRYSLFSSESIMIFSACKIQRMTAQMPHTILNHSHRKSICCGRHCVQRSCGKLRGRLGNMETCLLDDVQDIWFQLFCPICSHAEVELQVICVPLKCLAHPCATAAAASSSCTWGFPVHDARNKAPCARPS